MSCIGSTDREFKKIYYQHIYSFRNKKAKDKIKLSFYIHNANVYEANLQKNIKQRKPAGRIYILCNGERLEIALADSKTSLNSRNNYSVYSDILPISTRIPEHNMI